MIEFLAGFCCGVFSLGLLLAIGDKTNNRWTE